MSALARSNDSLRGDYINQSGDNPMQMQLEDFEEQSKGEWKSKKPLATVLGDVFVELNIYDQSGPPDGPMLKLANELVGIAQAHGELLLDAIYAHYRDAEESGHLEFWDVPNDLPRDKVLSEVESVTLSVSRDSESERRYDSCIHVVPNWELEHNLFLRYVDGQFVMFDPMAGE
jgi:hypothetical protein